MIDSETFKKMLITKRLRVMAQYVYKAGHNNYVVHRLYHDTVHIDRYYMSTWSLVDGVLSIKNEPRDIELAQFDIGEYHRHVSYYRHDRQAGRSQVNMAFDRMREPDLDKRSYCFWNVYKQAVKSTMDDTRFTVR